MGRTLENTALTHAVLAGLPAAAGAVGGGLLNKYRGGNFRDGATRGLWSGYGTALGAIGGAALGAIPTALITDGDKDLVGLASLAGAGVGGTLGYRFGRDTGRALSGIKDKGDELNETVKKWREERKKKAGTGAMPPIPLTPPRPRLTPPVGPVTTQAIVSPSSLLGSATRDVTSPDARGTIFAGPRAGTGSGRFDRSVVVGGQTSSHHTSRHTVSVPTSTARTTTSVLGNSRTSAPKVVVKPPAAVSKVDGIMKTLTNLSKRQKVLAGALRKSKNPRSRLLGLALTLGATGTAGAGAALYRGGGGGGATTKEKAKSEGPSNATLAAIGLTGLAGAGGLGYYLYAENKRKQEEAERKRREQTELTQASTMPRRPVKRAFVITGGLGGAYLNAARGGSIGRGLVRGAISGAGTGLGALLGGLGGGVLGHALGDGLGLGVGGTLGTILGGHLGYKGGRRYGRSLLYDEGDKLEIFAQDLYKRNKERRDEKERKAIMGEDYQKPEKTAGAYLQNLAGAAMANPELMRKGITGASTLGGATLGGLGTLGALYKMAPNLDWRLGALGTLAGAGLGGYGGFRGGKALGKRVLPEEDDYPQ